MRSDDAKVLQEVQKNAKMAMKAIDTIGQKVYDDDLSMQLSRQAMKYSELYNKASDKLLESRKTSYQESGVDEFMLKGGIQAQTLLNTSTSHIAELVIKGSNMGITNMWKTINRYENAGNVSMEIANELIDFEEKNIERLKKYL